MICTVNMYQIATNAENKYENKIRAKINLNLKTQ
jgi:hypothetical protein